MVEILNRETPEGTKATIQSLDYQQVEYDLTLYHEAGHAVMALVLGMQFKDIVIYPKETSEVMNSGSVRRVGFYVEPPENELECQILQIFAGLEAECLRLKDLGRSWRTADGKRLPFHPGVDKKDLKLILKLTESKLQKNRLRKLRDKANLEIREYWPQVEKLADFLDRYKTVSYAQCLEHLEIRKA